MYAAAYYRLLTTNKIRRFIIQMFSEFWWLFHGSAS